MVPNTCPAREEPRADHPAASVNCQTSQASKQTTQLKKWAKNQKRGLFKKRHGNGQPVHRGRGECSASLINGEMQIKITKIYHLTPVKTLLSVIGKIRVEC